MTNLATELYQLWSSFDIPAYPEYSVPSNAEMPYITYTLPLGDFKDQTTHQIRLWYKDTSLVDINSKSDEIIAKIGSGMFLKTFSIFKGQPLSQLQSSEDINLKIIYMNFILDF